MNMIRGKYKRNNIIRAIWKSGKASQSQLGKRYGLTQTRINAIIHRTLPSKRYCNYCKKDTLSRTKGVCPSCRDINLEKRKYKDAQKQKELEARREARKAQHIKALERRERVRERSKYESNFGKKTCKTCSKHFVGFLRRVCNSCKKAPKLTRKCIFCAEFSKGYSACLTCAPLLRSIPRNMSGRDRIRSLVRIRDKHTCQDCGFVRTPEDVQKVNSVLTTLKGKMKSLDVHHLNGVCGKKSLGYDSYKEIEGLITLCHKCHYSRHDFQPTLQKSLAR